MTPTTKGLYWARPKDGSYGWEIRRVDHRDTTSTRTPLTSWTYIGSGPEALELFEWGDYIPDPSDDDPPLSAPTETIDLNTVYMAERSGWPKTLIKALSDTLQIGGEPKFWYVVKIREETKPWYFCQATLISDAFVRISGFDSEQPWPHLPTPRHVDVRVAAIEWISESST